MNDFRQYVLVGGMPQVINEYLKEKNFEAADIIKRRILKLYRDDVSKFAKGYENKVFALFDGIPSQLTKKEKNICCHLLVKKQGLEHMKTRLFGYMKQ